MAEASCAEPTPLLDSSIRRLHRRAITAPGEIRALLEAALTGRVRIWSGVDRRNSSRTAQVHWVGEASFGLRVSNIPPGARQLYFSFTLDGAAFFFACVVEGSDLNGIRRAAIPAAIYEAERRDLRRQQVPQDPSQSTRVELRHRSGAPPAIARVCDRSYDGLGVSVPEDECPEPGDEIQVRFLDGNDAGETAYAKVRHKNRSESMDGWVRLGMSVTKAPTIAPIRVETRESILTGGVSARAWRRIVLAGAQVQAAPSRLVRRRNPVQPKIVEYQNDLGQKIVGILDGSAKTTGGTAVLIPPSWGRTKETFLPLARTIVKTFQNSDEQISVLRFDGTNRRGESFIDPVARRPGDEYLRFTFSQAVEDIRASARFLRAALKPRNIVLVTFSLASIEGRRAMAEDSEELFAGWISVVGMVDLQSGLRAVSGGVDYAYGLLEGVSFGRHELVGVVSDMDHTGRDALDNRLVFLEDARRDLVGVSAPISWLHGRHDAWMDLDRVVTLLSSGDVSARRLIEIPTGHELRSSREAIETFQLVAREAGRIALGKELKPVLPDLTDLGRRREAERSRLPRYSFRPVAFWRDYVLGREGQGGIGLLTATDAYRSLMDTQVTFLDLGAGGHRVLDLGAGTGEFSRAVDRLALNASLTIVEVDIVQEALRGSLSSRNHKSLVSVSRVAGDLDLRGNFLPFATGSADRILASLLLSYLESPEDVLAEARRVLRPGGVLVVSSLRRDADISKIYATGVAELQADRVHQIFGPEVAARFEVLQREFLNSASRLLDLEEMGRFRFFDEEELVALLETGGFNRVVTRSAFGDPPQAFVAAGRLP